MPYRAEAERFLDSASEAHLYLTEIERRMASDKTTMLLLSASRQAIEESRKLLDHLRARTPVAIIGTTW